MSLNDYHDTYFEIVFNADFFPLFKLIVTWVQLGISGLVSSAFYKKNLENLLRAVEFFIMHLYNAWSSWNTFFTYSCENMKLVASICKISWKLSIPFWQLKSQLVCSNRSTLNMMFNLKSLNLKTQNIWLNFFFFFFHLIISTKIFDNELEEDWDIYLYFKINFKFIQNCIHKQMLILRRLDDQIMAILRMYWSPFIEGELFIKI